MASSSNCPQSPDRKPRSADRWFSVSALNPTTDLGAPRCFQSTPMANSIQFTKDSPIPHSLTAVPTPISSSTLKPPDCRSAAITPAFTVQHLLQPSLLPHPRDLLPARSSSA